MAHYSHSQRGENVEHMSVIDDRLRAINQTANEEKGERKKTKYKSSTSTCMYRESQKLLKTNARVS